MSQASDPSCDRGDCPGKLFVIGFGPGGRLDRTHRADEAILASSIVVGYKPYLDRISDLLDGKELLHSGMRQEVERVNLALDQVSDGATVALVSSGDAGIYGMAGLALQLSEERGLAFPIEIVPGVTAATAAAARIGAILMLDYATISLSDLLVPWDTIKKRLEAVLAVDMVVALYNPKSKTRTQPFEEMLQLAAAHRAPETPVIIATALGQPDEHVTVVALKDLPDADVTMRSIVILGNSTTTRLGRWVVTPRGY